MVLSLPVILLKIFLTSLLGLTTEKESYCAYNCKGSCLFARGVFLTAVTRSSRPGEGEEPCQCFLAPCRSCFPFNSQIIDAYFFLSFYRARGTPVCSFVPQAFLFLFLALLMFPVGITCCISRLGSRKASFSRPLVEQKQNGQSQLNLLFLGVGGFGILSIALVASWNLLSLERSISLHLTSGL